MSNRTCKSLEEMGQANERELLMLGEIVTKKTLTPMTIL
jgi:hypothetical protein